MSIERIALQPGVFSQYTPALASARAVDSNLIRWRDGLPEKLGGWSRYFPFALGSKIRKMHAWQDLSAVLHLALGAEDYLSVITNGQAETITPQKRTSNPVVSFDTSTGSPTVVIDDTGSNTSTFMTVFIETPVSVGGIVLFGAYPIATTIGANSYTITAAANATANVTNGGAVPSFVTTNGSPIVTVNLNNHGYLVGSLFPVLVSTTGGGITLFGLYTVQSVPGANSFTIIAANAATSVATFSENGGNVRLTYHVAIGPLSAGSGWGIGAYGSGGWGTGTTTPPGGGTPITTTSWTLDNFGEELVANPRGGPIYHWNPNGGFQNASVISSAPFTSRGIFVAMPQQQLIAYGTEPVVGIGLPDPLIVRWTDVGNFNVWTATQTNQAGSRRLSSGSMIVGGMRAPTVLLLWTDIGLWTMSYIGFPGVYGFLEVANGCGLIAQHAAGILGGSVYWPSSSQFNEYSAGGVRPLQCDVWDYMFRDINPLYIDKTFVMTNSDHNEIAWGFVSTASGGTEPSRYVKYNKKEGVWDNGRMVRTAWIDRSILGSAIGSDDTGLIFQHETSRDADGQPMNPWIQWGYFLLSEGSQALNCDMLLPDFMWGMPNGSQDADLLLTLKAKEFSNDADDIRGPYSVNSTTRYVSTRLRGNMMSFRVEGNDQGSFWRLGRMRANIFGDGTRP
jgi:hypothetical protein